MLSKTVSIQEAQTGLSKLIASIGLDREIVIVENTKPLARLVPPNTIQPPSQKLSKPKKVEGFFNYDPENVVHINSHKHTQNFTVMIEKEADDYVAFCPELDIASQGNSVEKAHLNLKEAIELFFECADSAEIQERLHNEVFVTRLEVAIG